jgi:molybdopterin-guanine dinucleotide biosynthesis protein B
LTATAEHARCNRRVAHVSSGRPASGVTAFSPPKRLERPPAITIPTTNALASIAVNYITSRMQDIRVLGIMGWSGAGKTTLLTKLIPALVARGLRVATLKHAHHEFDVDKPGKDSYEHRKAGASEVIISSARRWVQMHELGDEPEARLALLLRRLTSCDLALVEGFKSETHPKLEVFRAVLGKPALHPGDRFVIGIASDRALADAAIPVLDLNDIAAIADFVIARAVPLQDVLAVLDGTS